MPPARDLAYHLYRFKRVKLVPLLHRSIDLPSYDRRNVLPDIFR